MIYDILHRFDNININVVRFTWFEREIRNVGI